MKKASKIILINPKKEILLYLRDNKPTISHPDYWDFIGGEGEKGETSLQTIQREIKEEINSRVSEIKILNSEIYNPLNTNVTFFKGKINENIENINLTEGQKLGFFKLLNLPSKFPFFYRDFIHKNKHKIFD